MGAIERVWRGVHGCTILVALANIHCGVHDGIALQLKDPTAVKVTLSGRNGLNTDGPTVTSLDEKEVGAGKELTGNLNALVTSYDYATHATRLSSGAIQLSYQTTSKSVTSINEPALPVATATRKGLYLTWAHDLETRGVGAEAPLDWVGGKFRGSDPGELAFRLSSHLAAESPLGTTGIVEGPIITLSTPRENVEKIYGVTHYRALAGWLCLGGAVVGAGVTTGLLAMRTQVTEEPGFRTAIVAGSIFTGALTLTLLSLGIIQLAHGDGEKLSVLYPENTRR
jgi:hypothetical protein